jgi:hypothetical protein
MRQLLGPFQCALPFRGIRPQCLLLERGGGCAPARIMGHSSLNASGAALPVA